MPKLSTVALLMRDRWA